MKKPAPKPPLQAFPARETTITGVTSVPLTMPNGVTVDLQKCSQVLESCLQRVLVNYNPVRFLFIDPPGEGSLRVQGAIYGSRFWAAGRKIKVELDVSLSVTSVQGYFLGHFQEKARSNDFKLPPQLDPCSLAIALEPLLEPCFATLANRVAQSPTVNQAPWHSDVLAVDGDQVIINGGQNHGLEKGNLFGVYREVPADPSPVYMRVTTIQVALVGHDTSQCVHYQDSPKVSKTGDRVLVHRVSQDDGRARELPGTRGAVLRYTAKLFGQTPKTPYRAEIDLELATASADGISEGHIRFFESGTAIPKDGFVPGAVGVYVMNLPMDRLSEVLDLLRTESNIYFGPIGPFDNAGSLQASYSHPGRSAGARATGPAFSYAVMPENSDAFQAFPNIESVQAWLNKWGMYGWEFLNVSVVYRGGKYYLSPSDHASSALLLRRQTPAANSDGVRYL